VESPPRSPGRSTASHRSCPAAVASCSAAARCPAAAAPGGPARRPCGPVLPAVAGFNENYTIIN